MLKRLLGSGANREDLVDVYAKQISSVLELALPAWQSGISQAEKMGSDYDSYRNARRTLSLVYLEARRNQLCLKFGKKAEKHEKFKNCFKLNDMDVNTRREKFKYCEVKARLGRFKKSPISFLTNMLNDYYSKPRPNQ